jgi:glycosyltransferase involved in cell wall biosynthesis
MKPKFSVVVITKNEEKTISRLVASAKEFMDRGGEFVVVDTASQDSTVKIAKELGCKVFEAGEQFVFTIDKEMADAINKKFVVEGEDLIVNANDKFFDFSKARNYAASLASNDWICYCDADEVLTKLDIDKINGIIENNPELGQLEYEFIFAKDNFGNRAIVLRQSKFYNKKLMSWRNSVHEILLNDKPSIPPIYLPEDTFLLEHYQNQETNRHSYLKGLAVDCYRNLDNDRNSHYLAREMFWNGRPKSAIKEFQRHIQMNKWPAEQAQSYIHMGDCYGMLNEPLKQIESYQKAINIDGDRREAWLKLAGFYRHNKEPQKTACYAKAALQIPHNSFYANNMADYTYEPHRLLYWAYGWLGDIDAAKHHILTALKYLPVDKNILADTKYYFEYASPEIEGWMTFPELLWLYELGKKMNRIAEIGSWKGRSTDALLKNGHAQVYAIDTWLGSTDAKDETNWRAKQEDIFETFKKNVGHYPNLSINRKLSLEAVKDYEDGFFDAIFVDANHTYEEVKADILAWLPKAKKIISGHDYNAVWPDVVKAVDEIFGKPDSVEDSIWWIDLEKRRLVDLPSVSLIIPHLSLGNPKREEGLKRVLASINNLFYPQHLIQVIVEQGDETVPVKVKNALLRANGEWIAYLANDTEMTPYSLYNAVKMGMESKKGLIAFSSGELLPDAGDICTHFIIKRILIPLLDNGEIFSTSMSHVGTDNFLWEQCVRLGEALRCEDAIVHHYHFSKGENYDLVYAKGWTNAQKDRELLAENLAKLNGQA